MYNVDRKKSLNAIVQAIYALNFVPMQHVRASLQMEV